MKLFSVIMSVREPAGLERGETLRCDALEHKGAGYLVLSWRENLSKQHRTPARVLRLDTFGLGAPIDTSRVHTIELVPRFVIEDRVPRELSKQYPIQDGPIVAFPMPDGSREPTEPIPGMFHPNEAWPL